MLSRHAWANVLHDMYRPRRETDLATSTSLNPAPAAAGRTIVRIVTMSGLCRLRPRAAPGQQRPVAQAVCRAAGGVVR